MGFVSRVRATARSLRGGAITERALDEELDAYVALLTAEKTQHGMDPAAARREALLEAGSMETVKEQVREARGGYVLAALLQDVRYAFRSLAKNKAYTFAIVLTLTLGVGATTAIFTVVRAVLLRELPYAHPEQLVRMWPANPSQHVDRGTISVPEFADWQAEKRVFSHAAAYSTLGGGLALIGSGEPVRLRTAYVSGDFFNTMGVRPLYGRAILPAEDVEGANHVVVMSYGLWQSRFGGDMHVIGRTLRLDGEPFTVIGIMPAAMRFPSTDIEVWTPLTILGPDDVPRVRWVRWLQMVARLQPGVTPAMAQRQLDPMEKRFESTYASSNAGWSSTEVISLRDDIIGPARGRLLLIFGTVLLILLLGCVNVANLVLARATQRTRELAVRAALGASRARLVRQLLTESVLLSMTGGVIGVALAWWGSASLARMSASWLPLPPDVRPDWMVVAFAFGICVIIGVAFGLIPAGASFSGLSSTLRDSGRGNSPTMRSHAMRRAFVVVELALAVILVTCASLFVQSFRRLSNVDLGYDAAHIAFARFTLPEMAPEMDRIAPAKRMLESVRAMPGVVAAALIKHPPLRGEGEPYQTLVPGRVYVAGAEPRTASMPITPGYFDVMGMKIHKGRDFTERDDTKGAVILSEAATHLLWGDHNPVGESIRYADDTLPVVGVVSDVKFETVDGPATPMVYVTEHTMPRAVFTVVARGSGDATTLLSSLRQGIRTASPDQPISELATMQSTVQDAIAAPRFLSFLLTLFGALAILLSAIGVYGVVSYVVGQRTNEIGIRMALGAHASGIVAWTFRTGMAPVVIGLTAGIAGSVLLARLIASQLFEVRANSASTYVAVVGILTLISLAATAVPAVRATRVSPTEALRAD